MSIAPNFCGDFATSRRSSELRQRPAVRALEARFGAEATLDALRAARGRGSRASLARRTRRLRAAPRTTVGARIETGGAPPSSPAGFGRRSSRVINATGVIIHTNLGRAPLAASAIARVADVARGYASLEYDVARGERGRRDVHADALLCRLTGAEAAVVVNNNAAATMIILSALAAGREVIVSRGELVEIGGGFRVPDVMAQSGAILREVGTTNKTRASDYAAAINETNCTHPARPPVKFSHRRVHRTPDGRGSGRGWQEVPHPRRRRSRQRPSADLIETWSDQIPIRSGSDLDLIGGAGGRGQPCRAASTSAASAATNSSADPRPASSSGARRSWTAFARIR